MDDTIYKQLLGIALVDTTKLPYIMAKVKVEDIPIGAYRIIYRAIVDLYNMGVDVDIVTVSNHLLNTNKLKEVGGRGVVNDLALEAPASRLTNSIVDSVIKQNTYLKLSSIVDDFKHAMDNPEDASEVCMDYCSKISNIVSGANPEAELETLSDGYKEVLDDLYEARRQGVLGIDTGFPKLNYFLGGLQKGKIYIIGARPSQGKSALAMNISEYVSRNHNVLFVSLEMSRKEYTQRLLFGRAGIDINCVNTGRISEYEISKVKDQKEYLDSLNLFVKTKTPCKVSDIEVDIINIQASRGSCDLVVVDYLQLLTPSTKGTRNREVEVAEISRELKSLAVKYNVPIIILSQLSRALESREDKRPMLSDLRESGAIEQDADVVMFVYRDEFYHPDDPLTRGKGEILIRKNRGGVNNKNVYMNWQPSAVRFTEEMEV